MTGAHAIDERVVAIASTGTSQFMLTTRKLLNDALEPARRVVRTSDVISQADESYGSLYALNSGFIKIVTPSPDGREQVVGLKMRALDSWR